MAKYTARITLVNAKPDKYEKLYDAMDHLGFKHLRQPTGEYIKDDLSDVPLKDLIATLRKLLDIIHTPNSGVIEKGDIATW